MSFSEDDLRVPSARAMSTYGGMLIQRWQTSKHQLMIGTQVLRTGMHLHMMLYMLDELFYVYRGVGANDADGQRIVAYEILTVVSLYCTEWCGNPKKACNTLGNAYPRVNLNDVNALERLPWAIYDGVYVPSDLPVLTGHHNWEHMITEMTLHFIFHGVTASEHCEPSTVASPNAKQAMKLMLQQGLLQPKKGTDHITGL